MRRVRWLIALVVLTVPAVAFATDLSTEEGMLFDIQDGAGGSFSTDGSLSNGSVDAYDGCYRLVVNGVTYNATGMVATLGLSGRQSEMPEMAVGALRAQRFIYVPMTMGRYGRYLDVVSNPGATEAAVTIAIQGNLGSDSSTVVMATASGDMIVSNADNWFATDDTDGSSDPSLAHVVQGDGARVRASSVTLATDNLDYTFTTTIPAGGRVALLTFAVQSNNQTMAQAEARRLIDLPDDAIVGLDDYLDDIINFSVAAMGAPRVRFGGPFTMDEGGEVMITADVTDPEGDAVTWDWDVDGDGTYGEMPMATSVTIAPGTTDGPGDRRVGVHATDGTNVTERVRTVSVTNVAPEITSDPPSTTTSVGAMYRYQVVATDPAGALDPLMYTIARGPSGMVVSDAGLITWTPDDRDVTLPGETVTVTVHVDDGDMGAVDQTWDMTVSPNRAPSSPTLIYPVDNSGILNRMPRLVVANATDPDLDALTYFFEIDRVDTFDSADLASSGPVTETPGFSFWYVPSDLAPGRWYWRAWVSDGTVETEPRAQAFIEVPMGGELPDAGVVESDGGATSADAGVAPTPRDDSGCGCVAAGTDPRGTGLGTWLAVAGALVVVARRQRRR